MKKTLKPVEDVKVPVDTIQAVDKYGKPLLPDPKFLGTAPIYLSRTNRIKAVQMFLPPGVSRFFVERIDKNHIRFLISSEEVDRLAEKVATMEKGISEASKKSD